MPLCQWLLQACPRHLSLGVRRTRAFPPRHLRTPLGPHPARACGAHTDPAKVPPPPAGASPPSHPKLSVKDTLDNLTGTQNWTSLQSPSAAGLTGEETGHTVLGDLGRDQRRPVAQLGAWRGPRRRGQLSRVPLGHAHRSLRSWLGLLPRVLAAPSMVTVHKPPFGPSLHPEPPGHLPGFCKPPPAPRGPAWAAHPPLPPSPVLTWACPPARCSHTVLRAWEPRAGPPSRSRRSWTSTAVLGFATGHGRVLPSGAPIIPSPLVLRGQGGDKLGYCLPPLPHLVVSGSPVTSVP